MVQYGLTVMLIAFIIAVGQCLAGLTAIADDIDEKIIARAKTTLQVNQQIISSFAHPTSKLVKFQYLSHEKIDTGFKLNYRLDYISATKRAYYSKLAFEFDVDGNYRAVTEIATSAILESFVAADRVGKYVRDKLVDQLGLQNDKELADFLDKGDVKAILRVIIKSNPGR
jgi:hypothetical protein